MRHIKLFEEIDYRTYLQQDKDLRNSLLDKELRDRQSKVKSDNFRSKLSSESEERSRSSRILEDRERLTHLVIQSLVYSSLDKDGFGGFKSDLEDLLNKYPISQLPKSGFSIYRKNDQS